MIEMICGAYGAKGRLVRPTDGPFSLSTEEEKRLVGRGVARYVTGGLSEPEGKAESPEPPQPEMKKPPKQKNPGKEKSEEAPPNLSPEDPVT